MELKYVRLDEVDPIELMTVLNESKTRVHLVEHDVFDAETINAWIRMKLGIDATSGCRVRGILADSTLAGWCGIQYENECYELAIVLGARHWGLGRRVFGDVMAWAKAFGHEAVFVHLLHTRPAYRFLRKQSKNVFESEYLGRTFTSYQLPVP